MHMQLSSETVLPLCPTALGGVGFFWYREVFKAHPHQVELLVYRVDLSSKSSAHTAATTHSTCKQICHKNPGGFHDPLLFALVPVDALEEAHETAADGRLTHRKDESKAEREV